MNTLLILAFIGATVIAGIAIFAVFGDKIFKFGDDK